MAQGQTNLFQPPNQTSTYAFDQDVYYQPQCPSGYCLPIRSAPHQAYTESPFINSDNPYLQAPNMGYYATNNNNNRHLPDCHFAYNNYADTTNYSQPQEQLQRISKRRLSPVQYAPVTNTQRKFIRVTTPPVASNFPASAMPLNNFANSPIQLQPFETHTQQKASYGTAFGVISGDDSPSRSPLLQSRIFENNVKHNAKLIPTKANPAYPIRNSSYFYSPNSPQYHHPLVTTISPSVTIPQAETPQLISSDSASPLSDSSSDLSIIPEVHSARPNTILNNEAIIIPDEDDSTDQSDVQILSVKTPYIPRMTSVPIIANNNNTTTTTTTTTNNNNNNNNNDNNNNSDVSIQNVSTPRLYDHNNLEDLIEIVSRENDEVLLVSQGTHNNFVPNNNLYYTQQSNNYPNINIPVSTHPQLHMPTVSRPQEIPTFPSTIIHTPVNTYPTLIEPAQTMYIAQPHINYPPAIHPATYYPFNVPAPQSARSRSVSITYAYPRFHTYSTPPRQEPVIRRQASIRHKKQGMTKTELKLLKVKKYKMEEAKFKDEMCVICLGEYCENESLYILPCKHEFHQICVQGWLLKQRTCPLCRNEVNIAPRKPKNKRAF